MNNKFLKSLFTKKKTLDIPTVQQDLVGWHERGTINTLDYYKDNQYENGYGSIQAITKQFFAAKPFALSVNGAKLPKAHLIDVLSRPNDDMSGMDFREALSIMTLVHDKVYIRVHATGSKIHEGNVEGFTFLEGVTELEFPQGTQYKDFTGNIYGEDEVIVLKNINPYNLDLGYSTAKAAKRWATLDDYVAAYQTGYFRNGAIPAGIITLTAATTQEFEDMKRSMQAAHRGADKVNNVVYSHNPINPDTGMPSTVDAVKFQETSSSNKDLAMKDLFDQVQKKVDSAYGVPASMRGVSEGSTYTNIRVDQMVFIDNCVRPFANKIWSRFTHELNRITGGLGYTITVDIETPHIAEEDKAKAEAQATQVGTLQTLLNMGATLETAIEAIGLEGFDNLKIEDKPEPVAPVVEDVPEVDQGDEVDDAPEVDEPTKALEPINVSCKHCGRYLFKATGTTIIEDMPCPKCKATQNFKIINELGNDETHRFTYLETDPTDIKHVAQSKAMTKEQIEIVQNKVASVIRKQMEEQITKVDIKSKALGDEDIEKLNLYAEEILVTVQPVIVGEGMKQYLLARTLEGISGEDLNTFVLDEAQISKYRKYLQGVVKSYSEDTSKAIRKSLETSVAENLPVQEVQKNLQGIMQTDEYRVRRLALSETNRAGNAGSISAMEQVGKDAKIKIEKVWQVRGDACEYCRAMDGVAVGVSETFVEKGASIDGVDGGKLDNNFVSMDVPTAHSNCGCYCIYKVVK